MSKRKSNLDEMQEQKLLKIEHNGLWFVFWGLLAAIVIQLIIGGENLFRTLAGEFIVFVCLDVYLLFSFIKNGIWDRKLKPNFKTNIILSLIAGVIGAGIVFATSYVRFQKSFDSTAGLLIFIFPLVVIFAAALIALTVFGTLYKKRLKKLEDINEKSDADI